jgi:ankyrin repeat protein
MGGSQSSTQQSSTQQSQQQQQQFHSLSSLLDSPVVNWDLVRRSIRESPEQACLYAQHVEPSQLMVALSKRGCPVDVIQTLLDSYDDAVDHNYNGRTVLHVASTRGCDADIIQLLLSKRPKLATVRESSSGLLPLHQCRTVGGAKLLLTAYPEGIYQRSRSSGSIPLHHVLLDLIEQPPPQQQQQQQQQRRQENTLNIDLCRLLIGTGAVTKLSTTAAGGLLTRNKRGQTPLSLFVQHLDHVMEVSTTSSSTANYEEYVDTLWDFLISDCLPLLMTLLKSNTKSAERNLELHTLIEYACCHSKILMDRALHDYNDQASQRDPLGRTPLHIAALIGSSCSTEALQSLIDANPKAPRMTDNEGRLPIDWAAESPNTPIKSLSLLIKGEPRAVDTRDLRNGYYPFVSAAISECTSVNNTYYLLRAKPHVLSYFHTP